MLQMIDRIFKPDACFQDLLQIDFAAYASLGFKLVLLDIDNTLARHGAHQGDDFAREAVRRIFESGMDCRIISNAATSRTRQYATSLSLSFTAMANKPSPKALLEACRRSGIPAGQAIMVGDQLLTDIAAARRAGCLAILVRPRYEYEAWNVRLKRLLEKTILRRYIAR
ncbi:MAG TPA: YqeG family HAD IIIA-type phosphatase [Clostridiales bacterium]|nr:YqeG family HAD IIIA-type phosphatase [Clostridiales bacterium]